MSKEDSYMRSVLSWPVSAIAAAALPLAIAISVSNRDVGAQVIPTDPQGGCPVTAAKFASWFETGVPALNGVVKPADSVNFPTYCTFYDWSKQMFLWLTSPAPSEIRRGSRIFNSPVFFDVAARRERPAHVQPATGVHCSPCARSARLPLPHLLQAKDVRSSRRSWPTGARRPECAG